MFEDVVYISGLKPDFYFVDLENELELGGHPDEIICDYIAHDNNAIFLSVADVRFVDQIIARYNCKQLLGFVVCVSRLTPELMKVLNKLKVIGRNGVPRGLGQAKVMGSYNTAPPFTGIQYAAQKKPLAGLGDILEAFDSLSMEQQMQLKATFQQKPVQPPSASHSPTISSTPCPSVHTTKVANILIIRVTSHASRKRDKGRVCKIQAKALHFDFIVPAVTNTFSTTVHAKFR